MPGSCFFWAVFSSSSGRTTSERFTMVVRHRTVGDWAVVTSWRSSFLRRVNIREMQIENRNYDSPTRASNDPWRISFSAAAVVFSFNVELWRISNISLLSCSSLLTPLLIRPVCLCFRWKCWMMFESRSLSHPTTLLQFGGAQTAEISKSHHRKKREARFQFNSPPPAFDFRFASLKVLHFFPSVELSRTANKTRPTIFFCVVAIHIISPRMNI